MDLSFLYIVKHISLKYYRIQFRNFYVFIILIVVRRKKARVIIVISENTAYKLWYWNLKCESFTAPEIVGFVLISLMFLCCLLSAIIYLLVFFCFGNVVLSLFSAYEFECIFSVFRPFNTKIFFFYESWMTWPAPLCWDANDMWSLQCQSCDKTTNEMSAFYSDRILFITGITWSPSVTARLPPGKKQFWTSIIHNAICLVHVKSNSKMNAMVDNLHIYQIKLRMGNMY